jgi:c-di-GMP-binding flagellar brake protein YcgR
MRNAARDQKAQEKRKFERLRVRVAATVVARSLGSGVTYKFTTQDISAGGVFISGEKAEYPFEERTLLEIWLHLSPDQSLSFLGKIVHHKSGGFGIKIVQIEDGDTKLLSTFIADFVRKNPSATSPGEDWEPGE